jgi:hypothetical protein
LEIASCFSDNVLQADLKAFSALMQHIAEKDPQREVVIMMQIENAHVADILDTIGDDIVAGCPSIAQ